MYVDPRVAHGRARFDLSGSPRLVADALARVFADERSVAVLLAQRLIGAKRW